jgi:hypothetical protein
MVQRINTQTYDPYDPGKDCHRYESWLGSLMVKKYAAKDDAPEAACESKREKDPLAYSVEPQYRQPLVSTHHAETNRSNDGDQSQDASERKY